MSELTINLAQHQFDDGSKIFSDAEIRLKNKNFIFAKNGSGKSTLSEIIECQMKPTFDVQIFNGFSSLIGENENLDAFALAVGAGDNEKLIKQKSELVNQKNSELGKVNKQITDLEGKEENLFSKLKTAKADFNQKMQELNQFCTDSARVIREKNNPRIVKSVSSYDARSFKRELSQAENLQDSEVVQYQKILDSPKKQANKIIFQTPDFSKFLQSVNEIITSKVETEVVISRIGQSQAKRDFAKHGLEIYQGTHDEICAFCGNQIEDSKLEELKHYFDADKVKELKTRISNGKQAISKEIQKLEQVRISVDNFYPTFTNRATEIMNSIEYLKKKQIVEFWKVLFDKLDKKDLFEVEQELIIPVPAPLEFDDYNKLVEENDLFTQDFKKRQDEAMDKLRYHEVMNSITKNSYYVKKSELDALKKNQDNLQKEFSIQEQHVKNYKKEIFELQSEIERLKPKAEKQAIEHINKKLKSSVSWQLDFAENEQSGYYNVIQNGSHRSVKMLSTGEKNIIAFLYFIEKLEEVKNERNPQHKIIIFDDPMNSNDDTMQYLIITELQKLYRSVKGYNKKFNPGQDYIVILSHNVHFYLNVQPHGSYEDKNGKTKYDKSNFYRLQSGKFTPIRNEKEDFKRNYDAIWFELQSLVDANLHNSMLNSMRRIIETYIEFNSLNPDKFYQGNEQYLKLFNVNSHSAIESISADSFTETAEELKALFKQIFIDNEAEDHFISHWKEEIDE